MNTLNKPKWEALDNGLFPNIQAMKALLDGNFSFTDWEKSFITDTFPLADKRGLLTRRQQAKYWAIYFEYKDDVENMKKELAANE